MTTLVAPTVKVSASNAGDPGSIPSSGRFPGEGNCNPLQYPKWGHKESDMTEQLHFLSFFTTEDAEDCRPGAFSQLVVTIMEVSPVWP